MTDKKQSPRYFKYSCNGGFEHDFSNEYSEYCSNGCGEKQSVYTIKVLNNDLEQAQARIKTLESEFRILKDAANNRIEELANKLASNICGYCWDKMYTDGYPSKDELQRQNKIMCETLKKISEIDDDGMGGYLTDMVRHALNEVGK